MATASSKRIGSSATFDSALLIGEGGVLATYPLLQSFRGDGEAVAVGIAVCDGAEQISTEAYGETLQTLRERARAGAPLAEVILGLMYHHGQTVPRDDREAARWFRHAAEQGEPHGQYCLGLSYFSGRGVPDDDTQAAAWFRRAAEQGLASAQFYLGVMSYAGLGMAPDMTRARHFFRLAGERGHVRAQALLGIMSMEGADTPANAAEARRWFEYAASQGDLESQFRLGLMCSADRQESAQDTREKLNWFRRAADGGHATAQLIMGISCRAGRDMPRDLVEAYKWLSLAASREPSDENRTTAIHECEATAAQMTPAQLAEAQRRARTWLAARNANNPKATFAPAG
jgi:TPR repeat protein